jgi:midasin (ATPase involved in ribosome maturation)
MDDQIDGKTLLGSYVCSERPGEFRWQPGSLTQVCFLSGYIYIYIYSFDKNSCIIYMVQRVIYSLRPILCF